MSNVRLSLTLNGPAPPPPGQHRTAIAANKRERVANSRTLHDFNTWLVGGTVSQKRELNRIDTVTLRSALKSKDTDIDEKFEQRKQQIQQEQQRPTSVYHPIASDALLRLDRIGVVPRGHGRNPNEKPKVKRSPAHSRPTTSPSPEMPHPASEPLAVDMRRRLKSSMLEDAANSTYVTLFPPMFTPYDREVTHNRGFNDGVRTYHDTCMARAPTQQLRTIADIATQNTSLRGGDHKAFFPTGAPSTAYRHFTNYRLAVQSTMSEDVMNKAKDNRQLQDVLRRQTRSPTRPAGLGLTGPISTPVKRSVRRLPRDSEAAETSQQQQQPQDKGK
eukprot:PhM_4_TR12371/c0_g1_i1/m.14002